VDQPRENDLVFATQEQGGCHVSARPAWPHTQGDTLTEATANALEALALHVEGL
jgi:predicted RNase H-like HicB family nuclease